MNFNANHLSKEKIRNIADDVRRKNLTIAEEIPVPVEFVIQKHGIEVRPTEKIKEEFDVEGFLSNDCKTIFIDNHYYKSVNWHHRVRFTLAHELGHFILHREFLDNIKFDSIEEWNKYITDLDTTKLSWFEWQANEFAGRFLVPKNTLIEEIEKDERNIKLAGDSYGLINEDVTGFLIEDFAIRFAKKFMVSPEVLEYRVKNEGLEGFFRIDELDLPL